MAKIRAIVNGVCFYTNTSAIKNQTTSDFCLQNTALLHMLDRMGTNRGFASTVAVYDSSMRQHKFDVQLSVC